MFFLDLGEITSLQALDARLALRDLAKEWDEKARRGDT